MSKEELEKLEREKYVVERKLTVPSRFMRKIVCRLRQT